MLRRLVLWGCHTRSLSQSNKMRRRTFGIFKLKTPIQLFCMFGSFSFIIIQIVSVVQLNKFSESTGTISSPDIPRDAKIGKLGKMVINMLPEDLAFTLFLPSEKSFDRDLRLNPNNSLIGEKAKNSYAILTRVLGFSAVPRFILAADLEYGKEMIYHSISGFDLYVSKDLNEMVVVNGVVSEEVGLKMGRYGNTLVHVMDGVVMDAEFEESIQPEDEEEDN